jgi:Trypsin-co-occurring domain 1
MPKKIPQFFQEAAKRHRTGSNVAVYTIAPFRADEERTLVLVECSEGAGNVPRNVASIEDLNLSLASEMDKVRRLAQSVVESLKQLSPGEVEIEFGVELGGAGGIPMVIKSEAKANFKVRLKWKEKEEPKALQSATGV